MAERIIRASLGSDDRMELVTGAESNDVDGYPEMKNLHLYLYLGITQMYKTMSQINLMKQISSL